MHELTCCVDKSAHELRQEAIAKQIAELESENVGEKDWTLLGEATSRKRPHNSLLEEDLEFEHTQRPVVTTSTSQIADLEALIKQRILEVCQFSAVTHDTALIASLRNDSTMCKRSEHPTSNHSFRASCSSSMMQRRRSRWPKSMKMNMSAQRKVAVRKRRISNCRRSIASWRRSGIVSV